MQSIFEGGMATCFAYGQTGSGKTHVSTVACAVWLCMLLKQVSRQKGFNSTCFAYFVPLDDGRRLHGETTEQ